MINCLPVLRNLEAKASDGWFSSTSPASENMTTVSSFTPSSAVCTDVIFSVLPFQGCPHLSPSGLM